MRVLAILLLFAWPVCAQPSMQTILTNGPSSNRLNVVILSEGYTTNQVGQFLVDATNAFNVLLAYQPYQEYRSYFNGFAIKVASNESGSDHPNYPIFRDTYFNSTYDPGSALITIPPDDYDANYSHGQGKVDALLQTFMPNCQLPVLLVNDPEPGGSDGFDLTAISAVGVSTANIQQVLPHETGHVLANLGDEYAFEFPGFPDVEEPNTTRQTNRAGIKWNAWISTNTPVPTPTSGYSAAVGLFEGAHYHATGCNRPKQDCAMRSFSVAFCEVCSEALVLAFYQRVRPVDAFAPVSTNLFVSTTQALNFSVTLLQPTTHNLSVQWQTNGIAIAGATNTSFSVLPLLLGNGTQTVSAVVHDNTALVRHDSGNLLGQIVRWNVNVAIAQLKLDSPLCLPGGNFAFRVTGAAPQGFVLQSSTNLFNWSSLSTNALVSGQFWFTNTGAAAFSQKYFRAALQ